MYDTSDNRSAESCFDVDFSTLGTPVVEEPKVTCPADMWVERDYKTEPACPVVNYQVGANGCGSFAGPIQTSGLPSGSTFPIGTTTSCFELIDYQTYRSDSCCFDVNFTSNWPAGLAEPLRRHG